MEPQYRESLVPQVELFLSGRGLRNRDLFSKSDTFAVVYLIENGRATELGRTEVLMDNLNPDWHAQFVIEYLFGEIQTLNVKVYDEDRRGSRNLSDHQLIGELTFTVDQLMGQTGQAILANLTGPGRNLGKLWIRAEQVQRCALFLRVALSGRKLANKDGLFGKSDPYITASRCREDGIWQLVWKSERIDNNLNPNWKGAMISLQLLCNGDMIRPIKFEIFDWDRNDRSEFMGGFTTSVEELMSKIGHEYNAIDEAAKKKKRNYTNSGTVLVREAEIFRVNNMIDYLQGGCELSLIVAIDFTASNGHPTTPQSLHYVDPTGHRLNEYEGAILGVGSILEQYDTDKRFPAYGFGARLGTSGVSHCFRLSADGAADVHGVEGILQAYRGALHAITLSGPTLLCPVIEEATRIARESCVSQTRQKYFVLLIIADGVINDMQQTIDAVIAAGAFPISIIIVGVGGEDFSDMRVLDADDSHLMRSDGAPGVRDIVQFVEMRKYTSTQTARLAADVLREIPRQMVEFFNYAHIDPLPHIVASSPPLETPPGAVWAIPFGAR